MVFRTILCAVVLLAVVAGSIGASTARATVSYISQSLVIEPGGVLDITDNDIVVGNATPFATLHGYVANGYAGGNWNGTTSIVSANADLDPLSETAVGIFRNTAGTYATFGGLPVSTTDVIIGYTGYGDANLDGSVNSSDLSLLLSSFGGTGFWDKGNFNYSGAGGNGAVDSSDLSLLLSNFGQSFPGVGASSGFAIAPVPEPGSLVLMSIGVAGAGFAVKRRRRAAV